MDGGGSAVGHDEQLGTHESHRVQHDAAVI
jgi:hypothetical protein